MRHLDLSYEGRQMAERNQPNNGKLPHGGYRGGRKNPPSHLSFDKGREFQYKLQDEIDTLLADNEIALKGTSPSWALLVSREPSYTDESPLITNSYMAASKLVPSNGISLQCRTSLLPSKKSVKMPQRKMAPQFYRPNSTHQYLSATELKNSSEGEINIKHGRPTRTTLLRARQRCSSAPMNAYELKRESEQRLDEIRTVPSITSTPDYLQLDKEGESLHSFLTGARYNRAHCLDSRSVDHTGVYMPRHNPAMGCFFTGPKGHEFLREFQDTARSDMASPASPPRSRRRPTTAPNQGRRLVAHPPPSRTAWTTELSPSANHHPKHKQARLNIVGYRLPIAGLNKDNMALKLPLLQGRSLTSPRRHHNMMTANAIEDSYRAFQPPPTPISPTLLQPSPWKLDSDRTVAGNDNDVRQEEDEPIMITAMTTTTITTPSVNVPVVNEDDGILTDSNEEETAFAAATVAAAIAAAVKEVARSGSKQPDDNKSISDEAMILSSGGKEVTNQNEEEMLDKTKGSPRPDEDNDEREGEEVPCKKPAVAKGVRFFITEKTAETKEECEEDDTDKQDQLEKEEIDREEYIEEIDEEKELSNSNSENNEIEYNTTNVDENIEQGASETETEETNNVICVKERPELGGMNARDDVDEEKVEEVDVDAEEEERKEIEELFGKDEDFEEIEPEIENHL